jgi:predicted alpha/beta-fold hydrolase
VGALGISLGSSSVMGASHPEGAEEAIDGGILAIAGPADVDSLVERLDRKLPLGHPFWGVQRTFKIMLISKVRALGWPREIASFRKMIEEVIAPRYGVTPEEIYERASAKNHVAKTRVPMLILHGADDEVVPVDEARILQEAAKDNDNVRVWIVPGGGHAGFDAIDPDWTYRVYRTFFERLATY